MRFVKNDKNNDKNIERNCIASAPACKKEYIGKVSGKVKAFAEKISDKLERKTVSAICIGAFALAVIVVFNLNFSFAYNAFMGDTNLGYVPNDKYVQKCMDSINAEFSRYVSGEDIVGGTVVYIPSVIRRGSFTDMTTVEENIKSTSDVMVAAYAVEVDGIAYAALEDENSAKEILEQICEEYKTEKSLEVSFKENVEVVHEYVPASILFDAEVAKMRLQGYKTTYNSVAVDKKVTVNEFAKANNLEIDYLKAVNSALGDELSSDTPVIVPVTQPVLTVVTSETVTYDKEIPFEEKVTEDAGLYEGVNKITRNGANGTAQITEKIERENGEVVKQTVVKSEVKAEPVMQLRTVGTKYRPAHVGTGDFIRPYGGMISSRFGARSSGNHTGVDFCGTSGDPIVAADSGTVTFADWSGGYGKVVKIDHNNGYVTYYAHCSELYVKKGDVVQKGEVISALGSTGNSTGPHVHFEVRYEGDFHDPMSYVE